MIDRCRACTSNDVDALVDEIAERLYEVRREGVLPPWERAGDYWQRAMRHVAREAIDLLHSEPRPG